MTILHDDDRPDISGSTVIAPRALDSSQGTSRVSWEENVDIAALFTRLRRTEGASVLPTGLGGYVVIGLNVDGDDDLHEIHTQAGPGEDHLSVIDKAIDALQVARAGIAAAHGLTVHDFRRAAQRLGIPTAALIEAMEQE